jgi:hypothetical protein
MPPGPACSGGIDNEETERGSANVERVPANQAEAYHSGLRVDAVRSCSTGSIHSESPVGAYYYLNVPLFVVYDVCYAAISVIPMP